MNKGFSCARHLCGSATLSGRSSKQHRLYAEISVLLQAPRTGSPEDDAMLREASAKVLWNLCYTEESRSTVAEAGGVELLVDMLTRADTGRSAAARALWNLAYSESNRERIAAAGGVSLLVGLLRSSDSKVRTGFRTKGCPTGIVSEHPAFSSLCCGTNKNSYGLFDLCFWPIHDWCHGNLPSAPAGVSKPRFTVKQMQR